MTARDTTSFDVFETVLVRQVGEPSSLFLLLGKRLAARRVIPMAPEIFARERMQAGFRAKRHTGRCDPTLSSIYNELNEVRGWSQVAIDSLIAAELELEAELLRPWTPGVRALDETRRRGDRIVFVSDTYLPASFVVEQLSKHGLHRPGDMVIVSCEAGGTKSDRTLFPRLRTDLAIRDGGWLHIGNSPVADVAAAREAGFVTRMLPEGNLNRYETLLEVSRWETGGVSSVFAGASRLARAVPSHSRQEQALIEVAAGVAAPMLCAFVLWVLHRAEQDGVERLYFLSREGQVLARLAKTLAKKQGRRTEVHYLYSSRQAMNLAALEDPGPADLAWALTHNDTNTTRSLLARVGLDPEDLADRLLSIGLTRSTWDAVPENGPREHLITMLHEPRIMRQIGERAVAHRELVDHYLGADGFFDDLEVGLVDVSGVGSQFRALGSLRSQKERSRPHGYLFLRGTDPSRLSGFDDTDAPPITAYYNDAVRAVGKGPLPGLMVLLEVFCAADHGTLLRFEPAKQGPPTPVLGPPPRAVQAWGLSAVRATIDRFAEALLLDHELLPLDADLRTAIEATLAEFWNHPTADEAMTWGRFPFEGSSGLDRTEHLARPTPLHEWAAYRLGRREQAWYGWQAASLQLSTPLVRGLVKLLRIIRQLESRASRWWRRRSIATNG